MAVSDTGGNRLGNEYPSTRPGGKKHGKAHWIVLLHDLVLSTPVGKVRVPGIALEPDHYGHIFIIHRKLEGRHDRKLIGPEKQ